VPTKTWSSGNTLTAADMNTYVRDLEVTAVCAARAGGAQAIVTAADTGVLLSTEDYDTDGIHSTASNTSRFTPVYAGYYFLSGYVQLSASSAGNYRQVAQWKNGSGATLYGFTRQLKFIAALDSVLLLVGVPTFCNGSTDYLESVARHDSGTNRTVTSACIACYRLRA
jgi:hypothetical protein